MKATGIVKQIDDLGRIVIPKVIKNTFGLEDRDSVEIFTDNDCIILKKYHPGCVFCGEITGNVIFRDKLVCSGCLTELSEMRKSTN